MCKQNDGKDTATGNANEQREQKNSDITVSTKEAEKEVVRSSKGNKQRVFVLASALVVLLVAVVISPYLYKIMIEHNPSLDLYSVLKVADTSSSSDLESVLAANAQTSSVYTVSQAESSTLEKVNMPDIVGKKQEEAQNILQAKGYTVVINEVKDALTDVGVIVAQSPEPTDELQYEIGDSVILDVALEMDKLWLDQSPYTLYESSGLDNNFKQWLPDAKGTEGKTYERGLRFGLGYNKTDKLKFLELKDNKYSSWQRIKYFTEKKYTAFKGKIVCADANKHPESDQAVVITMFGDGELIYTSNPISYGMKEVEFKIDIAKYDSIEIYFSIPQLNAIDYWYSGLEDLRTDVGIVEAYFS